jgi:hypothetical protein
MWNPGQASVVTPAVHTFICVLFLIMLYIIELWPIIAAVPMT